MSRVREGKPKKKHWFDRYMKSLGFTNRLALYLIFLLTIGLVMGFVLALLSIKFNYAGALACWTVVFTPMGTALSVVLAKIVDKSKAENRGPNGEGIKWSAAQASNFVEPEIPDTHPNESDDPAGIAI